MSDAKAPSTTVPDDAALKAAFDKYDTDKSGFLDTNELFALAGELGVLLDSDELEAAFKQLDTSGDGKIQFGEFKAWMANPPTGDKSLAKLSALKGQLYSAHLAKFLSSVTAAKDDGKSGISIQVGEMKASKVALTYEVKHDSAVKDHGAMNLAWKFEHNNLGGDFKGFASSIWENMQDTIDVAHSELVKDLHRSANRGRGGRGRGGRYGTTPPVTAKMVGSTVNLSFPSATTAAVDVKKLPLARELKEVALMAEAKLGNAGAKFELGYSVKDVVDNMDKWTVKDLLNFRVTFKGTLPPEIQGMVGQFVPMLEAQGFKAEDIPGLSDLLAGKTDITANLTSFVHSVLGMAPPPMVSSTLKDLLINFSPVKGEKQDSYRLRRFKRDLGPVLLMLQVFARDFKMLESFKLSSDKSSVQASIATESTLQDVHSLFTYIFETSLEAASSQGGR